MAGNASVATVAGLAARLRVVAVMVAARGAAVRDGGREMAKTP
ncbi:MAG TPA: hypothetical protein PK231_05960 [Acidocella sp.]|nr:hypothetical protein [Acidocella sp.]